MKNVYVYLYTYMYVVINLTVIYLKQDDVFKMNCFWYGVSATLFSICILCDVANGNMNNMYLDTRVYIQHYIDIIGLCIGVGRCMGVESDEFEFARDDLIIEYYVEVELKYQFIF